MKYVSILSSIFLGTPLRGERRNAPFSEIVNRF